MHEGTVFSFVDGQPFGKAEMADAQKRLAEVTGETRL
jgi:hypothetical protein